MLGQEGTRALEALSSTAGAHCAVKTWWEQEWPRAGSTAQGQKGTAGEAVCAAGG